MNTVMFRLFMGSFLWLESPLLLNEYLHRMGEWKTMIWFYLHKNELAREGTRISRLFSVNNWIGEVTAERSPLCGRTVLPWFDVS